ncbi:hypothetical protein [Qipengyuania nanhaisediminis]|uniref:Tetratricopeptide repeat-containing protein n=1 Tax=Qipengyuania nanhaisediminis TaxID=604088 RepID=A0A1I5KAM0_9SPHN|nr:hypothetical protein [Qipengyuania nanhaisediminis]SFO82112.1 hypothetical protein SAMN04488060_0052 [Qipengyuania nanhaisediminis]
MLRNAVGYLSLLRALFFAKRGNASRARKEFQTAQARLRAQPEFADAFDARILMMEGRGDDARLKLSQTMKALETRRDDNGRYISLYCRHFLEIYDRDGSARARKTEADTLSPSGHLLQFLPFFSKESISRIIDEQAATQDRAL